MPSAREISTSSKPSSFMKCSCPGFRCRSNNSRTFWTLSALASSTVISCGRVVMARYLLGSACLQELLIRLEHHALVVVARRPVEHALGRLDVDDVVVVRDLELLGHEQRQVDAIHQAQHD